MRQRALSLLVCLALLLGLCTPLGGSAAAAGTEIGGNLTTSVRWSLSGGTLTISGSGQMHYSSTTPWDSYKQEIRKAVVEYGVTSVGNYSFSGCSNLTQVELAPSVTTIADSAFAYCTALTSIDLPTSVELIASGAFKGSGLTSVEFPGSVDFIYAEAFAYCDGLTEVILPDTIHTIGSQAFFGCENLTTVDLPAISVMGDHAFGNCPKLKTVYWPRYMNISYDYFMDCNPLTVYYGGSQEDWSYISNWKYDQILPPGSTIYYNSDGSHTETPDPPVTETPEPSESQPPQSLIPTPILKSAACSGGEVTVEWSIPQNTASVQYVADGYEILRKTGTEDYILIGAISGKSATRYVDKTVEAGQTYTYTVRACYNGGSGVYDAKGLTVTCPEAVSSLGTAAADGEYPITFRTDTQDHDLTYDFYYTEDYFLSNSITYDHDLAKMTLGLAMAGFSTRESDRYYTVNGDVGREDNIKAAYQSLGFSSPEFHNYDVALDCTDNKVAFSFARKTISYGGQHYTVVPVIIRGGGYGAEWSSDFYVNDDSAHTGFRQAAEEVYDALETYLQRIKEESGSTSLGSVKLWIGGYSRGAATANLLAALVCNQMDQVSDRNVYAYTFATPNCVTGDEKGGVSWDYHFNYDPLGAGLVLKEEFDLSSIHNIIYSGDAVPRVPLNEWGYHRNGNDMFLPATHLSQEVSSLNRIYREITGSSLDFDELSDSHDAQSAENALGDICGSSAYFEKTYQDAAMDIFQYLNLTSSDTARDYSISAVSQTISQLDHINQSAAVIAAQWPAAKVAAEGLALYLDVFKDTEIDTTPLVPIMLIGMIHGLTPDALGIILQLLIGPLLGFFPDDLSLDGDALSSIAGSHYPEVYLALMEYFDEDDFAMRPTTHKDDPIYMVDVPSSAWYAGAVQWAVNQNVTTGTSATTFSPDRSCTRAEVVTFLWRAMGQPAVSHGDNPFRDVSSDAYYYDAVLWAVESGVTTGTTSTTFSPNKTCSRAEVVTFLWRTTPQYKPTGSTGFYDVGLRDYFWYPVKWAVDEGITTGTSDTLFSPNATCTRSQVVTFLYRYLG